MYVHQVPATLHNTWTTGVGSASDHTDRMRLNAQTSSSKPMLTPAQQEAISSQHQQVRSLAIYEPHPLHALSVHIQQ